MLGLGAVIGIKGPCDHPGQGAGTFGDEEAFIRYPDHVAKRRCSRLEQRLDPVGRRVEPRQKLGPHDPEIAHQRFDDPPTQLVFTAEAVAAMGGKHPGPDRLGMYRCPRGILGIALRKPADGRLRT